MVTDTHWCLHSLVTTPWYTFSGVSGFISYWVLLPRWDEIHTWIITTSLWSHHTNYKVPVCVYVFLKVFKCVCVWVWEVWRSMYDRTWICENTVCTNVLDCYSACVCWFCKARPHTQTHRHANTHILSLSFPNPLVPLWVSLVSVCLSVCLCVCVCVCVCAHSLISQLRQTQQSY